MQWSVPKIWSKSDAFIIGGGPSIKDLDLTPIHDKRVIGVNNAFTLGHWVDICFFGDCRWWDWNIDAIRDNPCLKVTNCERLAPNRNLLVANRLPQGFSTDPTQIAWNGNSGASAINLAYLLGANRIFLIGFDMKVGVSGEHNFHDLHPHKPAQDIYDTKFQAQFKRMVPSLDRLGIEVFNLNPDSELKLFPFMTLEEACA